MNITPIFIHTQHVPETCPACNKPEHTVLVCRHCGHEYVEEESAGGWTIFLFIVIMVAAALFLVAFLDWCFKTTDPDAKFDKTFFRYLIDGAKYIWRHIITKLI